MYTFSLFYAFVMVSGRGDINSDEGHCITLDAMLGHKLADGLYTLLDWDPCTICCIRLTSKANAGFIMALTMPSNLFHASFT